MIALGVEIGGTKLQAMTVDASGTILARQSANADSDAGPEAIRQQVIGLIETVGAEADVIGVGFGGPVDWRTGTIARSHQVGGWDGFALADWLSEATGGRPVHVENDANAAAFAEAHFGAGRGADPVLYSNVGSGIGAGLVVGGTLYRGAPPGEMEVGHLRLDPSGQTVEGRCSGWCIDRLVREHASAYPDSVLAREAAARPGREAHALAPALSEGDADARRLLDGVALDYAFGLSHAVHLLHPEVVVLGGGVAGIGEPWRAAVESHLRGFVMEVFRGGLSVRSSELGTAVVPVGAATLALARASTGE